MDKARLSALLHDLSGRRVHVIGDSIRDIYTQTRCLGTASKSPTLVLERTGVAESWAGGASIVAAHCRAAGADVSSTTGWVTRKERFLVEGIKAFEIHEYREHGVQITDWVLAKWYQDVPKSLDIIICADFQHGVFTPRTLPNILAALPHDALKAADSQTTDISWGNILDFAGFDLLFANEREARFALRDQDSPATSLGEELLDSAKIAVVVKRGAHGLWVHQHGAKVMGISPYADQPIVDPIGAGDALLAYMTLAYHASKDLEAAAIIGSLAAAEACAHQGNVVVRPEAILRRLERLP